MIEQVHKAANEGEEKVVFAFFLSHRSLACEREFQEIRVFLQPRRSRSGARRFWRVAL
jgi:hypothetical protein